MSNCLIHTMKDVKNNLIFKIIRYCIHFAFLSQFVARSQIFNNDVMPRN